jgi:putative endonuclease
MDGEDAAAAHLEASGYTILERNYRCKDGELDIVAGRGRTIVFCEVKTRRSDRWGDPSEAVHPRKQARIRRLAANWLAERGARACEIRFDVVSVVMLGGGMELDHIVGAF